MLIPLFDQNGPTTINSQNPKLALRLTTALTRNLVTPTILGGELEGSIVAS